MRGFAGFALLVLFPFEVVFGCTCPDIRLAEAFRGAHTVVVGTAGTPKSVDGRIRVPVACAISFKGSAKIDWVDDTPEDACGFDMIEGIEYVLFLDSNLNALGCAGSHPIRPEERASVLKALGKIARRKA